MPEAARRLGFKELFKRLLCLVWGVGVVSRTVEKEKGPNCRASWAMAVVWASILKTRRATEEAKLGK